MKKKSPKRNLYQFEDLNKSTTEQVEQLLEVASIMKLFLRLMTHINTEPIILNCTKSFLYSALPPWQKRESSPI